MLCSKHEEFIHIGLYGLDTALHGRYGIALALKADADSPYSPEIFVRSSSGSTAMPACKIASEYKHLILCKCLNMVWSIFLFHIIY